jgi:hypothetical protein
VVINNLCPKEAIWSWYSNNLVQAAQWIKDNEEIRDEAQNFLCILAISQILLFPHDYSDSYMVYKCFKLAKNLCYNKLVGKYFALSSQTLRFHIFNVLDEQKIVLWILEAKEKLAQVLCGWLNFKCFIHLH